MWTTFLGKHIKPSLAEIVLALIPNRICNYQFFNRLDSLTLFNTRKVTFKLVAVKIRCSWFTQLYICASYSLFVFVNYCAFICYYSFSYFISLFNYFASFSFEFCFDCCSKEKEQLWPCSGISILQYNKYLLTVTCSPPSSRVNKPSDTENVQQCLPRDTPTCAHLKNPWDSLPNPEPDNLDKQQSIQIKDEALTVMWQMRENGNNGASSLWVRKLLNTLMDKTSRLVDPTTQRQFCGTCPKSRARANKHHIQHSTSLVDPTYAWSNYKKCVSTAHSRN
jgi:hypothetical protein